MLSPSQEQFLREFYALCDRYRQAGVVAYSHGLSGGSYAITVSLQTAQTQSPVWRGSGR